MNKTAFIINCSCIIMSNTYSAHPVLAAEQLQRAELEDIKSRMNSQNRLNTISSAKSFKSIPKKYINNRSCNASVNENFSQCLHYLHTSSTSPKNITITAGKKDTINRPHVQGNDNEVVDIDNSVKDCENQKTADEIDSVQRRINKCNLRHSSEKCQADYVSSNEDIMSELSSVVSSPSTSNISTPLSTPLRIGPLQQMQHNRQYCCQKTAVPTLAQHRLHHLHHQQQKMSTCIGDGGNTNSVTIGCKNKKLDARFNPSPYRQLLPIALCILSFAIVFATLIVYMDTTEIRHQQFRLNMSRDYELNSVAQDDPALIAFLRQIHMRKYPMQFQKNHDTAKAAASTALTNSFSSSSFMQPHSNLSELEDTDLAPFLAHYVADLVGGKMNGAVIQSLTGNIAHLITAPWLSETLNWMGVLVEPEPRWYFALRKQNAQRPRMQVVHACVSPNPYPKEVTIHNEDVRINSLHDEETSWFNSRVKCFPLYTIMLACDRVEYDLLSLGVQGHELEILQTLPFERIKIEVISIHLVEEHEDVRNYMQTITKFLAKKSYKLQRKFGRNYFYQRINSLSKTRKKDVLLIKSPSLNN